MRSRGRITRISAGSWSLSARSGSCRCWLCLSWREERATLAPARNHRTPRSDPLTRVSRWRQVDPAATCLVTGGGRELTSATPQIRRNRPNFRSAIHLLGWGTAVAYDFVHVSNDTRTFTRTAKPSGGVGLHAP